MRLPWQVPLLIICSMLHNCSVQDCVGAEELSVKTLANMFDFRLSDPSMSRNLHKLMQESKLEKFSSELDPETCSEC